MAINFAVVNGITDAIIGAAIKVHRALGPGLLESAYHTCLAFELKRSGRNVVTGQSLPLVYEGIHVGRGYEIDLLVDDLVIVEVKSVRELAPVHTAQILTYMKLTGCPAGLLFNFNVPVMRQGIRRLLNGKATKGVIDGETVSEAGVTATSAKMT